MRQLNVIMNTYVRDKQPQEVIEEARKQAHRRIEEKDKSPAEQMPATSIFSNADIRGLDTAKGIKRFNGSEKIYLDVLRSYAAGVNSMLDKIESFSADFNEENLVNFTVIVHGIKGTSLDIFAEQIAEEAKDLEAAGKAKDIEFIKANHLSFTENARKLARCIEEMCAKIDSETEKPLKDKPDLKLLFKLIDACGDFDMDGADTIMEDLEKHKYGTDNDLIDWLRKAIDRMQFEEIAEKLNTYISR